MKFSYTKSLEPNDKCNPGILLENQQRLKLLISKYKENWKGMEPSISVTILRNSETDEVEDSICRKQLRAHQDQQLIEQQIKFAIQRYKAMRSEKKNKLHLGEAKKEVSFEHFIFDDPLEGCVKTKLSGVLQGWRSVIKSERNIDKD
ncbi:hypothetical protein C0J52_24043 [Blattella germanica]|nr:hypothetical protein C0J52_24043 [Blattella germanica]